MKKNLPIIGLLLCCLLAMNESKAQSSFEETNLAPNSYNNGADFSGGFTSDGNFFTNAFDTTFGAYWEGFSISNMGDDSTKGFSNQYSAITGKAFDGKNYAIMYAQGIARLAANQRTKPVAGFYITNSTYAYYDMKEGSSFSKKFGGSSGNDSDYFRVVISAWKNGGNPADTSITFYLADYRFSDNSKDYIVNNWQYVNLSMFGAVDSFAFSFESSDTGSFGINTPQYFCMDKFNTAPVGISMVQALQVIRLYPNPAQSVLQVDASNTIDRVEIYTLNGVLVQTETTDRIDISQLATGMYLAKISANDQVQVLRFVKE